MGTDRSVNQSGKGAHAGRALQFTVIAEPTREAERRRSVETLFRCPVRQTPAWPQPPPRGRPRAAEFRGRRCRPQPRVFDPLKPLQAC